MCLFAVLPDKEASVGGSAAEFSQETLRGDVKVSLLALFTAREELGVLYSGLELFLGVISPLSLCVLNFQFKKWLK